ncbi:hypothetical protein Dip510_000845 [Elusimicrobium posterum]|uniref:ATP-binding protein n=1 Tax=Elusimicrobium posterum TaxID=3116653 RepID=UPI003C7265DF
MKIFTGSRGSGKTTEMLKALPKKGYGYIVVPNERFAREIVLEADELGIKINFPLTFNEFLNKRYYGKNIDWLVIDDVDALLSYITHSGVSIYAIALNGEIIQCKHKQITE